MQRSLFIITGASRGFGKSIALALADSPLVTAQPSDVVITARSVADLNDTKLAVEATFNEADVSTRHQLAIHTCAVDFLSANLDTVCDFIVSRTVPHPPSAYGAVHLFNNAGSLGKLARIRDQSLADVRHAIEINVTAPMLLTAAFLRRFGSESQKTVLVNVSSLAAIQPFDSWGVYSAGKAARDMLHRVIAIEEASIETEETLPGFNATRSSGSAARTSSDNSQPNNNGSGGGGGSSPGGISITSGGAASPGPASASAEESAPKSGRVRVLNYAPGPMDTDMQARIRSEMPDIPLRQVYVSMHREGRLVDPNDSAKVLISLLESDEYENGAHVDFFDVQEFQSASHVGK
ncbi:hypothetical protein BC831DRAFT_440445 [Entophlyctis helioformis]|nr:hypothetical protein BC831DRAFT_440445 [Entophlyctis helioformis]